MALSSDNLMQMRLNIKQHRLKLYQCLQNVDNVLKSKIKNIILNDTIKSNVKHNVKHNVKNNVKHNVKHNVKNNVKHNVKNNVKNNVDQKIASSAKLLKPKLEPIDKITNHTTTSTANINQSKNQIPMIEIEFEESNLQKYRNENKFVPIPQPHIEIEDLKPNSILKTLREELIEEQDYISISSDDNDDNISVGNNEDWNEIIQQHNENDSCYSSSIKAVKDDKHELSVNNKSKEEYCNSNNDLKCPTTSKRIRNKKRILNRDEHNAKERFLREQIAKQFDTLRRTCSYLKTNRLIPSKRSILLSAAKECNFLRHFEKRLLREKQVLYKKQIVLQNMLASIRAKTTKTTE